MNWDQNGFSARGFQEEGVKDEDEDEDFKKELRMRMRMRRRILG